MNKQTKQFQLTAILAIAKLATKKANSKDAVGIAVETSNFALNAITKHERLR